MATEIQETTDTMHPFEKAGLGKAPFRFDGFTTKVGPIQVDECLSVGAPGQPMGTCDYCGQGIALCVGIKSSDGNRFEVGCDCAEKLYKESNRTSSELARDTLYQEIKAAKREHNRKVRHKRESAKLAEYREWASENEQSLKSIPHPSRKDETLWDQYEWYQRNAGTSGNLGLYRVLKNAVAEKE